MTAGRRLPIEDFGTSFVDDTSLDACMRHPGRGHQPCRASTDNENIGFRFFDCHGIAVAAIFRLQISNFRIVLEFLIRAMLTNKLYLLR